METNLAGLKDGISERFVPEQDPGRLIEAEHISRYQWAAQIATGRRILDAGCGSGYGSRILAEAGAQAVVGVDIAEPVLNAIAPTMPETVQLRTADLRRLDLPSDEFDLVVCFEVIEHFEDPFPVLDELVRVLAPGGVLLTSSPNRGVYQDGNPHHFHEFTPDELRAALAARLTNVRLTRQSDYIMSAVFDDATYSAPAGSIVNDMVIHQRIEASLGGEVYTLALASDGELPDLRQLAALTGTLEMREWLEVFDHQNRAIAERETRIAHLEGELSERDRLAALLRSAEQAAAVIPELELRIVDLQRELAEANRALESAQHHARHLDERLMVSEQVLVDVMNSPSWQVTKPLRRAKQLLK